MPTERQKRLAKKVIENNGNVSRSMREVGYSVETAKNPQQVTNSKGWKELMDEYLPDETLAKVHSGLLEAESYRARVSGLDMAYKLKGNYAPQKMEVNKKLSDMSDEELGQLIDEELKKIQK